MSKDFTLEQYKELLEKVLSSPYRFITMAEYIEYGQPQDRIVVLRHDIDRNYKKALRLAELEASMGVSATYYIRLNRFTFKPYFIRQLQELGHEVGYHYEVLAKTRGNLQKARLLFAKELSYFNQIVTVRTISMHGSPLWPWNNLDIWEKQEYEDYGIIGEAYLSLDYANIYFFNDTGRNWDNLRFNLRDKVQGISQDVKIKSSKDLIKLIPILSKPIVISVHPNRWSDKYYEWLLSSILDWIFNRIKILIKTIYGVRNVEFNK